ncbi:MAG: hypothetical protein ACI9FB_002385 [Candidatus Azotimanducaceae bacterium]|jgi:hypothetical protein
MNTLTKSDLWSLEQYSEKRAEFRDKVLAHKQNRKLMVGAHMQLIFEDRLTIKYQVQEMLRIEKIFESDGIQEELDAYTALIPDGDNWKCTLFIQYTDVEERVEQLKKLAGVETKIWIQIGELPRIYPIADEDMDRTDENKTSAVHFLRFPLSDDQIKAATEGQLMSVGVEHPAYTVASKNIPEPVSLSLVEDLAKG